MKVMIFEQNWSNLSFWEKLDIIRAYFSETKGMILEKWDFILGCRVITNFPWK